jgi:predicted DNA-binding transcriptional regulator AlpA
MNTHFNPPGRTQPSFVRHLNQRDVASRWGMSVRTLERWRSCRQGPPFLKLGGKVVYRIEDIEAFEVAQRRQSTTN